MFITKYAKYFYIPKWPYYNTNFQIFKAIGLFFKEVSLGCCLSFFSLKEILAKNSNPKIPHLVGAKDLAGDQRQEKLAANDKLAINKLKENLSPKTPLILWIDDDLYNPTVVVCGMKIPGFGIHTVKCHNAETACIRHENVGSNVSHR